MVVRPEEGSMAVELLMVAAGFNGEFIVTVIDQNAISTSIVVNPGSGIPNRGERTIITLHPSSVIVSDISWSA